MESIHVTTGVTWVDIPEANLYILCGSPADIMKHLKQKGFVIPTSKKGIHYETGPNAILLSDVPVQNGQFSNLTEFPILHMLYFQGMGIPGHVNNQGQKPILIGTDAQIKAQLQYIQRGRYGLGTLEELKETGIPHNWADELFRIKNYYAYQNIESTEKTIRSIELASEAEEITGGVKIERLELNQFLISYKDKQVTVDLNLKAGTSYEPAVNLDYHQIQREYFSVAHLGEGDGWDINKPCMGSLLTFQGKLYLIDAGPFILHNLKCLGISINEIEGIFHTHLHDDHFAGLTSLMYTDHRIKYYSTPLVRTSVMKKLSALMGLPVSNCEKAFEIHDLELHKWNDVMGLQVFPSYSPHPVENNVFLFRVPWEGDYKQYLHLADISSLKQLFDMLQNPENSNKISKSIFHQMKKLMHMPVDLKKVDIGGGMIHGTAEDFQKDNHSKILLSHIARPLTFKEKEIGSSAAFGLVDILIPCKRNYYMVSAYNFLSRYYPDVPEHEIQLLMNNEITTINVGEIIIKKGQKDNSAYLILSGVVEVIDLENQRAFDLSSGSFIGETTQLLNQENLYTYRAASYVRALKLSQQICYSFLSRNYNMKEYSKIQHIIQNLQKSYLFGELLAADCQSIIARMAIPCSVETGKEIHFDQSHYFYLVCTGKIALYLEDTLVEEIGPGDFFGEDIYFYQSSLLKAICITPATFYRIPFESIEDIPIITWKMQESMERRIMSFGNRN